MPNVLAKEKFMEFSELLLKRQSTRSYDVTKAVEDEKITAILEAARLAPSACNGQPYHITVCKGSTARKVSEAVMRAGRNKFAKDVPVMLVISEEPYVATAGVGSKIMKIDYRSIDIGILSTIITMKAAELGLGSCMIGWREDRAIREACGINSKTHLVISIGYPAEDDVTREKKRKPLSELATVIED